LIEAGVLEHPKAAMTTAAATEILMNILVLMTFVISFSGSPRNPVQSYIKIACARKTIMDKHIAEPSDSQQLSHQYTDIFQAKGNNRVQITA